MLLAAWPAAFPVLRALGANTVVLAYDAPDIKTKPQVFAQLDAVHGKLTENGFNVELEVWE